jgi:prepilin-type N-terminal cleavage/methylation domain-containing protein
MKRGFTLIEVLVSLVLVLFMFAALFMVLSTGRTAMSQADTQIALQQEIRKAVSEMTREISSSGASQVSCPANGTNCSSLAFNVSQGALSTGAINWSTAMINYSLSSGQILRAQSGNTSRILANNISSLTFRRLAATSRILRINITASKTTAYNRPFSTTWDADVYLRNT